MQSNLSIALTAIFMLGLAAYMAPNIFALNRGKVLRNIALWLAIFAGLGLLYQYFGPGSKTSLVGAPGIAQEEAPPAAIKNSGDKGYVPPKE